MSQSDLNKTNEKCPRCGGHFHCQPENVTKCQCYGVKLSDKARAYVSENYTSCLCRKCLEEIELKFATETQSHGEVKKP